MLQKWALPEPEELQRLPRRSAPGSDRKQLKRIYYPHFSSAEVHPEYVDWSVQVAENG